MKKNVFALAALTALGSALAGNAMAQSSVTIAGIVDAGLVRETGGVNGTINKLSSGTGSVSRLIFRGTEDLGNGLSAIFLLESGFKVDTGEQDTAGSLFQRQSYVGLKSTSYGQLTMGRQYTPYYLTAGMGDPFSLGFAGNIKNLFPVGGNATRASNTVLYMTPLYQGVGAEFAYSPGEQAGDNTAGTQLSAALGYTNGPLAVRLGYLNRNTDTASTITTPTVSRGISTNTMLTATYDFKVIKAFVTYGADKGVVAGALPNTSNPYGSKVAPTASTDSREILLGLTAPVAGGTLMASAISKDDRTHFNQDARQYGIGYVYPLSKRTNVYTAYAKINNKNGAGYTVGNNGESGTGDTGFNLGLRHSF